MRTLPEPGAHEVGVPGRRPSPGCAGSPEPPVIHQVEAIVPGQCQRLTGDRLDAGIGRAHSPGPRVAPLFRRDPPGVWSGAVTGSPD